MTGRRLLLLAACALATPIVCSCGRAEDAKPAPSSYASAPPKGTLMLGERIGGARTVPLAEIAKSPKAYANQVVATSGEVIAVCQEMGCWMELRDNSGQAHVRMYGHTFFVPKTAAGHMARVQATVLRGNDDECAESPPPQSPLAKVQLDATGVEID